MTPISTITSAETSPGMTMEDITEPPLLTTSSEETLTTISVGDTDRFVLDEDTFIMIGVGAGAGVILIVFLILICALCIRQRKHLRGSYSE